MARNKIDIPDVGWEQYLKDTVDVLNKEQLSELVILTIREVHKRNEGKSK